jgi:hypothetical protein
MIAAPRLIEGLPPPRRADAASLRDASAAVAVTRQGAAGRGPA